MLYGFQGSVPFLVKDAASYISAVRQLLSISASASTSYTLVHTQAREGTVAEVVDDMASGLDGPALRHIWRHFSTHTKIGARADEPHPTACCVFFVRLETESGPDKGHFQPTVQQRRSDVRTIMYLPPGRTIPSTAYFSFPKHAGVMHDEEHGAWHVKNFDQVEYLELLRTATNVLLGKPLAGNEFHHAIMRLRLDTDCADYSFAAPTHGFTNIRPSDLQDLQPYYQVDHEYPDVGIQLHDLEPNQIHLTLPGFYPELKSGHTTVVNEHSLRPHVDRESLPPAISYIQNLVKALLQEEARGVSHILLLSGRGTLGSTVDRSQPTVLVPLHERTTQKLDVASARGLSQLLDSQPRSLLLYPKYEDWNEEARMHPAWNVEGLTRELHIAFPTLSSSVATFRTQVERLAEVAPGQGNDAERINRFNVQVDEISIYSFLASDRDSRNHNPQVEFPHFVIRPATTDDQWFAIRAQLPTRNVAVNIWRPGTWDWQRNVAKSNVWGPRYGAASWYPRRYAGRVAADDIDNDDVFKPAPPVLSSLVGALPKMDSGPQVQQPGSQDEPSETRSSKPSETRASEASTEKLPSREVSQASPLGDGNGPPAYKRPPTPFRRAKGGGEPSTTGKSKTTKCPFAACGYTFKSGQEALFAWHVRDVHTASKCMWCDAGIPEWWNDEHKTMHMRKHHRDRLLAALGVLRADLTQYDDGTGDSVSLALKPAAAARGPPIDIARSSGLSGHPMALPLYGPNQRFCDRCGRDRHAFFCVPEQTYHDRNCVPGIYHGARCTFCRACGDYRWKSTDDAIRSGRSTKGVTKACGHSDNAQPSRFCALCGLDTESLDSDRRGTHRASCRGYGSQPGRFCPHCGVKFWQGHANADWLYNTRHIETCPAKAGAVSSPGLFVEADDETLPTQKSKGDDSHPSKTAPSKAAKPRPLKGSSASANSVSGSQRGKKRRRRRAGSDDSEYAYTSDTDSDTDTGLVPEGDDDVPASGHEQRPQQSEKQKLHKHRQLQLQEMHRMKRRRRNGSDDDSLYEYESDVDSADELRPDIDDINARDSDGDGEPDPERNGDVEYAEGADVRVTMKLMRDKAAQKRLRHRRREERKKRKELEKARCAEAHEAAMAKAAAEVRAAAAAMQSGERGQEQGEPQAPPTTPIVTPPSPGRLNPDAASATEANSLGTAVPQAFQLMAPSHTPSPHHLPPPQAPPPPERPGEESQLAAVHGRDPLPPLAQPELEELGEARPEQLSPTPQPRQKGKAKPTVPIVKTRTQPPRAATVRRISVTQSPPRPKLKARARAQPKARTAPRPRAAKAEAGSDNERDNLAGRSRKAK